MSPSSFRLAAEATVRQALKRATDERWTAREFRRRLQGSYRSLAKAHFKAHGECQSTWYAAIKAVTGRGALDLPDFSQPELVARGPRQRRRRKPTAAADHVRTVGGRATRENDSRRNA